MPDFSGALRDFSPVAAEKSGAPPDFSFEAAEPSLGSPEKTPAPRNFLNLEG
jgi:hypothetical protein